MFSKFVLLFVYSSLEGKTVDSPTPSTLQLCLIREYCCASSSGTDITSASQHSEFSRDAARTFIDFTISPRHEAH